jgi:hypothetical protein
MFRVMKSSVYVGVAAFIAIIAADEPGRTAGSRDYCEAQGRLYFREIGSYPTLSDGRSADTVTSERCSRSLSAFQ